MPVKSSHQISSSAIKDQLVRCSSRRSQVCRVLGPFLHVTGKSVQSNETSFFRVTGKLVQSNEKDLPAWKLSQVIVYSSFVCLFVCVCVCVCARARACVNGCVRA